MRRILHNLFVSFLTAACLGKQEDSIIIKKLKMMDSPPPDRRVIRQFLSEWMECRPSIWFD
ncbi:hypothetical protein C457_16172 [Haloferax prahovense DSM 18310]|uniref:Uncharacterized protein n=1 Tax=Haloferax prahovense (strain DSM 18310 / JCM 13924 / TL6) TaxID=1227461 RepID=M0G2C1_HALPT|nr:hypothetical protein C457_16172 [Haloferax prahovense DSM 18310]